MTAIPIFSNLGSFAVVLGLLLLAKRIGLAASLERYARPAAPYAIGILASFWFFERLARAPATTLSLFGALFGLFYTAVVASQLVGFAQSSGRETPGKPC